MRGALFATLILAVWPSLATAKSPVLVELYTAQGCGSCGEANAGLVKLADRADVLALTFSVDYWDYLGWPDTFAKPEFADRQKAYVTKLGLREPYTPQIIIDGHAQVGGRQTQKIEALIDKATLTPHRAPDVAFVGARRVDVGRGQAPAAGADVWLVRYDPREQDIAVKTGDNRGQTVDHINVVREIRKLGAWRGRPTAFRLPASTEDGLATAVLVQTPKGGRILAVGRMPLAPRSLPAAQ